MTLRPPADPLVFDVREGTLVVSASAFQCVPVQSYLTVVIAPCEDKGPISYRCDGVSTALAEGIAQALLSSPGLWELVEGIVKFYRASGRVH